MSNLFLQQCHYYPERRLSVTIYQAYSTCFLSYTLVFLWGKSILFKNFLLNFYSSFNFNLKALSSFFIFITGMSAKVLYLLGWLWYLYCDQRHANFDWTQMYQRNDAKVFNAIGWGLRLGMWMHRHAWRGNSSLFWTVPMGPLYPLPWEKLQWDRWLSIDKRLKHLTYLYEI